MENTFITKLKHFGLIVCLDMQRIPSFDIAKAIALGAAIFGHCSFGGAPTSLVDFSYSFSMPTFFFISGYFCKKEPLGAGAIKKSASSLLIPYAITSALLIFLLAMRAALLPSEQVLPTVATWIVAALYGSGGMFPGMPEGVIAIGAIWYLWALFRGQDSPGIDKRDQMARYPRHCSFYRGRPDQGHDLAPLKHSAGALRSAVYACGAEGARGRPVR